MKRKSPKLSATSDTLIDSFAESAKTWGWESDQGTGSAVDRAEKMYKDDFSALRKRVLYLETELAKARADVRRYKPRGPARPFKLNIQKDMYHDN